MQRQRQSTAGGGGDDAQPIVASTLLNRLDFRSWQSGLSTDDVSLTTLAKPDTDRWTNAHPAPPEGINPGLARTAWDTHHGQVSCSEHGVNPEHRRQECRIRWVELPHHWAGPRHRILTSKHLACERRTRHLPRREQLCGRQTTDEPRERSCTRRGLLHRRQTQPRLQ